ncbi:hypothetical protein VTN77DRAFT_4558 [Rasamsonia byssochlamydoides]|uniref:uncharacterized protein n=1 Tax=Rasamsonia byssochlamydoides TaxID=89139 RepID=UPI003742B50E
MTAKKNLFKWGRKRDLSSSLDARWGDPAISAPNEGSWNEMPPRKPAVTEPSAVKPNKARRFVTMLRPKASDSPEHVETGAASVQGVHIQEQLPHHPLVDLRGRDAPTWTRPSRDRMQRPATRRIQSRTDYREDTGLENSAEDGRPESQSGSECASERESAPPGRINETRTRSADVHKSLPWPKSPPLASTARMRRYSQQSASTSNDLMTPSTGTFSSKHTSVTSATSAASALPLLAESPPMPKIIAVPPPSHSYRDHQTGRSATSGRAQKRRDRDRERVGPQELVPSYDELWGW